MTRRNPGRTGDLPVNKNEFDFEILGKVTFKGKTAPMQVYKIVPGKSPVFHTEKTRRVFSQMVGRDKELSIKKGEALLADLRIVGPLYCAPFMLGCLLTQLEELKQSLISENPAGIRECKRALRLNARQAAHVSKRHALYRTWIHRAIGEYYWLINERNKAVKWWNKAIMKGEELGSRLDLSYTYFEVGKRLLEPQSKYEKINGIGAKDYLKKAGILFEEIGLEGEMTDLERFKDCSPWHSPCW